MLDKITVLEKTKKPYSRKRYGTLVELVLPQMQRHDVGRPQVEKYEDEFAGVRQKFQEDPCVSPRQVARQLGITQWNAWVENTDKNYILTTFLQAVLDSYHKVEI